jgi:hypothetical protein
MATEAVVETTKKLRPGKEKLQPAKVRDVLFNLMRELQ